MDPIGHLKQFLTKFHDALTELSADDSPFAFRCLSRKEEGSLFLEPETQQELRQIVEEVHGRYNKRDQLSLREVERRVQDALFYVVDIRRKRSPDFSERVSDAIAEVQSALEQTPQSVDWWVPVRGVNPNELPCTFASGRFCLLDEELDARIQALAVEHLDEAESSAPGWERAMDGVRKSPGWGLPMLGLNVTAIDLAAAEDLATNRAVEYVDVLNYFSDLVPYHHGRVQIPGRVSHEPSVSIGAAGDGHLLTHFSDVDPPPLFSFERLREARQLGEALSRAEELLSKVDKRSKFEGVTLTAIAWAGRATVARALEESFLLFAIALESIVLPTREPAELLYRLGLRTAFLLESDAAKRSELRHQLKLLYGTRSEIVHNGSRRVTRQDVESMRVVAKGAITRVLVTEELRKCESTQDAAEWFEERILA